ncbi:MAG TPA: sulfite exporter TauE/SafE family protein [Chromatiales bacterium]|nr:sulfite exporter TauE/SafE family protein [Chromatiales bacterium]HEX22572.1 sulfite exporter TauE/SafE family protein [Chromatiales bacterium]
MMTALLAYISFISLGALAGLSAGLLGVGGGLILVPALLAIWQQGGVDSPWLMQMAIATSLASIVFTSISSLRAHHRRGAVLWPQVRRLAPGILLGAGLGAMQASWLPGQWLRNFGPHWRL